MNIKDMLAGVGFTGNFDANTNDSGFHYDGPPISSAGGRIPRVGRFKSNKVRRGVRRLRGVNRRLDRGVGNEERLLNRQENLRDRFGGQINNRIGKIDNRLGELGPDKQRAIDRLTRRRDNLQGLLGTPEQQTGGASPLPSGAGATTGGAEPIDYTSQINEVMGALFPDPGQLNWENYFNDNLYNTSLERGQEALDRYYRKKGLANSGAAIQGNADFAQDLIGKATDQAMDRAENERDLRYKNSRTLYDLLTSEAERAQKGEQNSIDNYLTSAQMLLNQSPLSQGYGAAGTAAGIQGNLARELANLTSSIYPSALPASAFHVASAGAPGYAPPLPEGPDYSASAAINAQNEAASGSNYASGISGLLSGLLTSFS